MRHKILINWHILLEGEFTTAIGQIHQLSDKKQKAIRLLASSDRDYLSIFLDIYTKVHNLELNYQQYQRDSFQYSITQAVNYPPSTGVPV